MLLTEAQIYAAQWESNLGCSIWEEIFAFLDRTRTVHLGKLESGIPENLMFRLELFG